ncbi:MAG: hypothetical protein WAP35_03355 [Solirubrobacterales bacterium]
MLKFTVQDLFVAGLAFDLIGASLLAKSLFKTPLGIAERATEFSHFDPHVAVQLAHDKIDGNFGLGYLTTGFMLQAIGYQILLTSADIGNERGFAVALTALLIAFAIAIPSLASWHLLRGKAVRRQVVLVSKLTGVDPTCPIDGRPSLQVLTECAEAIKYPRLTDESDEDYVMRIFDVTDLRDERVPD